MHCAAASEVDARPIATTDCPDDIVVVFVVAENNW